MAGRDPRPGDIYRHFKGKPYQITAIAYDAESNEKCVVYQALYGDYKTYVGKYDVFVSEVDRAKYPDVEARYRFMSQEEASGSFEFSEEIADDTEDEETRKAKAEYEMQEILGNSNAADTGEETNKQEGTVNPDLLAFLEAESNTEKIEVLDRIHGRITQSILCAIEASLDLSTEEGDLEDRIYFVRNFLKTKARYEGTRLR